MALRRLSFTEEERAFLQQRVALFWKVVLVEETDLTLTRQRSDALREA
jgi:hypothetical protein